MATDTHLDRCAICGGTREEHGSTTKHMFTLNPGELRPPPRQETATRRQGPDVALAIVSRLIETMVDKDQISQAEALSIFGVEVKRPPAEERTDVDGHNSPSFT